MFFNERILMDIVTLMITNSDDVIVNPAPAPEAARRFNGDPCGSLEYSLKTGEGVPLRFEIHHDHIEVWNLDNADNVILDYNEIDPETFSKLEWAFDCLKRNLGGVDATGFDQLEL